MNALKGLRDIKTSKISQYAEKMILEKRLSFFRKKRFFLKRALRPKFRDKELCVL